MCKGIGSYGLYKAVTRALKYGMQPEIASVVEKLDPQAHSRDKYSQSLSHAGGGGMASFLVVLIFYPIRWFITRKQLSDHQSLYETVRQTNSINITMVMAPLLLKMFHLA